MALNLWVRHTQRPLCQVLWLVVGALARQMMAVGYRTLWVSTVGSLGNVQME